MIECVCVGFWYGKHWLKFLLSQLAHYMALDKSLANPLFKGFDMYIVNKVIKNIRGKEAGE